MFYTTRFLLFLLQRGCDLIYLKQKKRKGKKKRKEKHACEIFWIINWKTSFKLISMLNGLYTCKYTSLHLVPITLWWHTHIKLKQKHIHTQISTNFASFHLPLQKEKTKEIKSEFCSGNFVYLQPKTC